MQTADLITAFLNNEMTAEQERQFLLSVAASDSLRLGLKSHVMVDRIFQKQLAEAHVAADVKSRIFAEMSASLGQVAPNPAPSGPMLPDAAPLAQAAAGKGMLGMLLTKVGTGVAALSLAVGGFAAGYLVHSELDASSPSGIHGAAAPTSPDRGAQTVSAPRTGLPMSVSSPRSAAEAPATDAPTADEPNPSVRSTAAGEAQGSEPRLATARRRTSQAPSTPVSEPRSTGHSATDAAPAVDPISGPASMTITSPGVPNREQSATGGTEESRVSVKATIRKPNSEDRRQTHQSEDQGMP